MFITFNFLVPQKTLPIPISPTIHPDHDILLSSKIFYGSKVKMARICEVTQKKPMSGHNVSHANNKTKRRFLPNLQHRKFWVESENRWINLRLSNAALRTIDKNGIDTVLAKLHINKYK